MAVIVSADMGLETQVSGTVAKIYVIGYMGQFGYFIRNKSRYYTVWIVNPSKPDEALVTIYPGCVVMATRLHEALAIRAGRKLGEADERSVAVSIDFVDSSGRADGLSN